MRMKEILPEGTPASMKIASRLQKAMKQTGAPSTKKPAAHQTPKQPPDDTGVSKKSETKFHAKLDSLVHDTFGKRENEALNPERFAAQEWRGEADLIDATPTDVMSAKKIVRALFMYIARASKSANTRTIDSYLKKIIQIERQYPEIRNDGLRDSINRVLAAIQESRK